MQRLVDLRLGCDGNAPLAPVDQTGVARHTGSRSRSSRALWDGRPAAPAAVPAVPRNSLEGRPLDLALRGRLLAAAVACDRKLDLVARGHEDGAATVAASSGARVVPLEAPARGKATALVWSPDGQVLAAGAEGGVGSILDLAPDGVGA